MQIKHSVIAIAYLAGTALADYTVWNEAAVEKLSGSSSSRRSVEEYFKRDDAAQCTDIGQCQGLAITNSCLSSTRHDWFCYQGACYVVTRDAEAFCTCLHPGIVWDDTCFRGEVAPGYHVVCVTKCQSDGSQGNGGCNAVDDPCKAS